MTAPGETRELLDGARKHAALIERARELADAATPGPWESGLVGVWSEQHGYVAGHPDPSMSVADRMFIAAARELVPALAAALSAETQRADTPCTRCERLEAALRLFAEDAEEHQPVTSLNRNTGEPLVECVHCLMLWPCSWDAARAALSPPNGQDESDE